MGTLSTSHQSIDPKQKTEIYYGYHQEHYTYPQAITPGYPISKHHQSHDNFPSISSFHAHETMYPIQQYPYPGYYYNHQQTLPEPNSTNNSFNRIMLILMTFLVGCMCMTTLVMWFLYGTYIPEFEVVSLKTSNFSITDTSLTGTWDASLVVTNTNQDLNIDFDNVRSVVLYRENILGFSAVQSFGIQKNEKFNLNFSVSLDEKGPNQVDNLVMHALDQDWRNGAVSFSLRLAMSANFSSTGQGYRQQSLAVSCDYLQIDSSPEAGEGRLSRDVRSHCLISL